MNRSHHPVPIVGTIRALWSDTSWGDLRPTSGPARAGALEQWAAVATEPASGGDPVRRVHWVEQQHGCGLVVVGGPDVDGSGPGPRVVASVAEGAGDALVSDVPGEALCVLTADCASVALGSREGIFAAVHAGWRGLVDGVVEAAMAGMRALGATEVVGALGPCIHPECYEFSEGDLATVAAHYGDGVRGRTTDGRPALDLPAAVSAALAAADVAEGSGRPACTACTGGYFSHRARGDLGRQALLVWSAGPA